MADHRHKRDANARRKPRAAFVAALIAFVATTTVVTLGVLGANPQARESLAIDASTRSASSSVDLRERGSVSRSLSRVDTVVLERKYDVDISKPVTQRAIRNADTRLWATEDLNLWSTPGQDARKLGILDSGKRVLVTGRASDGRVEVVLDGQARWVSAGYLTDDKPVSPKAADADAKAEPESTAVARTATCTNGSSVPSGVSPNIVQVHQAVCASFPELTSYGTFRSDGEHAQGIAIDIMVSGSRGWEVAEFVRANYVALGVSYLIYAQNIWSVERGGEGWRPMSDRGSTTANHYDHVHVTTY